MCCPSAPIIWSIKLTGDLDLDGAARVEALLAPAARADVAVLDCRDVEWIDSAGLGVLVRLCKRMRANGYQGTIRIVHARPALVRVFEITGLVRLFDVERTS